MRRLIRWLVVLVCLVLATALLVLSVATRDRAVSISLASNGTYRDVRLARGVWSATFITNWPIDQAIERGWRDAPPTQDPWLMMHNLPLREALAATLVPNTGETWWPLRTEEGRAFTVSRDRAFAPPPPKPMTVRRPVPLTPPTTTTIRRFPTPRPSATMPAVVLEDFGARAAGTSAPSYLSLSSPTSSSESAGNGLLADLARDTELTFRNKPSAKVALAPQATGAITFSGRIAPARNYARIALPQWAPLVVVTLPVVWIAAAALLRAWRRHRRRARGLCVGCGYDLRGAPEHACPECGQLPAVAAAT